MAGGSASKVREWMRKFMAPRTRKAAGSRGRELLAGAAPSARRWRKPRRGNALAALFRWASYHLLWLVESVVVVAQLVFFFVRFGFRV